MTSSTVLACPYCDKLLPDERAACCGEVGHAVDGKHEEHDHEFDTIPDGWCPVCGGKDGEHKSGCQDGSEIL